MTPSTESSASAQNMQVMTAQQIADIQTANKLYIKAELAALPPSTQPANYLCPLNVAPSSGLCASLTSTGAMSVKSLSSTGSISSNNGFMPRIQSGAGTCGPRGSVTVTFPTPFSAKPAVVAFRIGDSATAVFHMQVYNVTASSFQVYGSYTYADSSKVMTAGGDEFNWIAVSA